MSEYWICEYCGTEYDHFDRHCADRECRDKEIERKIYELSSEQERKEALDTCLLKSEIQIQT